MMPDNSSPRITELAQAALKKRYPDQTFTAEEQLLAQSMYMQGYMEGMVGSVEVVAKALQDSWSNPDLY